jgi:hypothetical protein
VSVSAAELGAAYRADPKAADASYKDRWVRVNGAVAALGADGTTFDIDAPRATVAVRRGPHARLSVPVRKGSVTVTGKCLGVTEPPGAGEALRITLTDAIVVRPPSAGRAKESR